LTEKAPYQALTPSPVEVYLQRALYFPVRLSGGAAQVRAAELSHRGAAAGRYPTLASMPTTATSAFTPAPPTELQVDGRHKYPFCGGKLHSDREPISQLKQGVLRIRRFRGRIVTKFAARY